MSIVVVVVVVFEHVWVQQNCSFLDTKNRRAGRKFQIIIFNLCHPTQNLPRDIARIWIYCPKLRNASCPEWPVWQHRNTISITVSINRTIMIMNHCQTHLWWPTFYPRYRSLHHNEMLISHIYVFPSCCWQSWLLT